MKQIKDYLLNNLEPIGIFISLALLFLAISRQILLIRKDKIDQKEFKNKKVDFSIYIQDGYRLICNTNQSAFLLFNIVLSNKASSKISLVPKLNIFFKTEKLNKVILNHDKNLFIDELHSTIDKFDNSISLEEKEIKSGWIIAKIPDEVIGKRINRIEILLSDSQENKNTCEYYLLRDISYENKNIT